MAAAAPRRRPGRAARAGLRAGAPRPGSARSVALRAEPRPGRRGAGGRAPCARGAGPGPGHPGPARRPRADRAPRPAPGRGPARLRALPPGRVAALAGVGDDRRVAARRRTAAWSAPPCVDRPSPSTRRPRPRRGSRSSASTWRPSWRSRASCARAPATPSTRCWGTWPCASPRFTRGRSWPCATGAATARAARPRGCGTSWGARRPSPATGPAPSGSSSPAPTPRDCGARWVGSSAERGLEGPGEWDDAVEAAWLGGLLS